jgi:protein O-GlcNAc transferase
MASVPGRLRAGGRVEAFWYATSPPDGSPWRARFEADAEHFLDASAWPARALAASIATHARAHVAIDLNGYTKGARTEVFALRPAPVQAGYMGFPDTLGAPTFTPWLISDGVASPPAAEAAGWYGEAVARLPRCYFVNDYAASSPELLVGDWTDGGAGKGGGGDGEAPPRPPLSPAVIAAARALPRPTRAGLGLPPRPACVFVSPNQLYKVDPRTLAAWAHILAAVPGSVLWLLRFPPAGEARLRAALATTGAGVDPARLIFTDVAPKADHLRRCGLADVALDTPLVNAHTTACDVLWAGVPLVTLPGARMAARVAASLARATGCGEAMVAASWADYEAKAVALGRDADGCRTRLAARLRAAVRGGCELFDTAGWVRDFERLLGRLWEEHVAGRPPTSFDLAKET